MVCAFRAHAFAVQVLSIAVRPLAAWNSAPTNKTAALAAFSVRSARPAQMVNVYAQPAK